MPVDPSQRERVRDDLRGVVRGDVLFGDVNRALYATDASIFEIEPLGAVAPRDEEDLQALVRYCAAQNLPLIARGAGTGMAGESLGAGILVDFTRHFRAILEIGTDTVRVQPGVVLNHLNARLAAAGRRFAPDPASFATCTIGGMLATNASGSRLIRHGYTREHVAACRLVLDNGDAVDAGRLPVPVAHHPSRFNEVVTRTAELLGHHRELLHSAQPRTPFNRCGYLVDGVLTAGVLDLPRLLVGSEGTLACFTEATLRTVPLTAGRAVVMLSCASLDHALKCVRAASALQPSACDLLERRLVSLTRSVSRKAEAIIPANAEALVLIEFEAERPAEAQLLARTLIDLVQRKEQLVLCVHSASEPTRVAELWSMRESALPSLYGLGRGARPVAYVEDVGVPPELLGPFLTRVQDLLQVREMTASYLVHAATGQTHIRPFLDLSVPADVTRLQVFAEALYAVVMEFGGTVSTQHGTGIARTPWVARQYGPLYAVFRELKSIWDPKHLLNPGKIVSHAPLQPLANLRRQLASTNEGSAVDRVPLLVWEKGEVSAQVETCNGCGHCRVEALPQRMCPMFRVTHAEPATPRAKANLLRRVLTDPDPKRLAAADVRAVAELCINCKMCVTECPAHVNIPKLMLETKAAYFDEHGLDRADWVLARMEGFANFGSRFAMLINPLLTNRLARWIVEKVFGISRRRRLPSFAWRSFLKIAQERGWTQRQSEAARPPSASDPALQLEPPMQPDTDQSRPLKVAYFVDVFANYNDPTIAEATVAVLQHNGIEVYVPPVQWGSGIAPLAQGDVEAARDYAQQNLRILAELARTGWRIVCSEPSAALMLTRDYLDLVDDPDARLVAENTVELTTLLGELHEQGKLRTDFTPVAMNLGHHVPCHQKALGKGVRGPELLDLIPQLRVHTIDVSCSGMAGVFGLKREQYESSLAAGEPMFAELRRPRVLFGSSECSACRLQMEEGSGKRAFHPVQYLALAYGLLPDLARRLRTPLLNRGKT